MAMRYLKDAVSDGKIFSVRFAKRTTGEVRHMVCRYGVRRFVKGIGLPFDPDAKGLLVVWDVQKKSYRMIDIAAVTWARVNGMEFTHA